MRRGKIDAFHFLSFCASEDRRVGSFVWFTIFRETEAFSPVINARSKQRGQSFQGTT